MGWDIFDLTNEEHDIESAVPIGSDELETEVTLTRIREIDGKFCYGEEVPAYRIRSPHEFRYNEEVPSGSRPKKLRWNRLAIKIKTKTDLTESNEHLIIAEFPYSSLVGFWVPFKKRNRNGISAIKSQLESHVFRDGLQFLDWMHSLEFDYGVSTADVYTASVFVPDVSLLYRTAKLPSKKLALVYGICADPDATYKALFGSQTAKDLLEYTSAGTLRFTKERGKKVEIKQKVKDLAPELIACSIRQAMAGLHKKRVDLIGKPVEVNVSYIYRDLINCLNRAKDEDLDALDRYNNAVHANSKKQLVASNMYNLYSDISLQLISLQSPSELPCEGELLVAIKDTQSEILVRVFDSNGNKLFDQPLLSKMTKRKTEKKVFELLSYFLRKDLQISQDDRILLLDNIFQLLAESPK